MNATVEEEFALNKFLAMPLGAEKNLAGYIQLVKDVGRLLEAKRITKESADIILGHKDANAIQLAHLIHMFETAGETVWAALAGGLTGGDYELHHAQAIVEVIEQTGWDMY